MYTLKLKELLESLTLKGDTLSWARKTYEKAVFIGEHELDQDEQDRIIDLWGEYC
jgi:hypothetical protein